MTDREKGISVRPFPVEIPGFVSSLIGRLQNAGFQAYLVGGAIRDALLHRPVTDWDIATSAPPSEIRSLFHDIRNFSLSHQTVTIVDSGKLYEVTTLRGSGNSGNTVLEDLGHRDFTIDAMAYDTARKILLDPAEGGKDLAGRIVRAVGDPYERFREDPVRLLRAVRIANELGFSMDTGTMESLRDMSNQLGLAALERIRDELMKILLSGNPSRGFRLMKRSGLLSELIPELLEGDKKRQRPPHKYTILRHTMETLDRVEPEPVMRLTALFHDIAKPRVRRRIKGEFRFFGHAEAGALLASEVMERLMISRGVAERVVNLIRHHMVDYDPAWGDGAVRRFIRRVGPGDVDLLLSFRKADIMAHGTQGKGINLISGLEKRVGDLMKKDFVRDTRDLAVDGNAVMDILGLSPGPDVGRVLELLMEKVTENPEVNTENGLRAMLKEMAMK